jgi:hypothetical protein
MTLRHYPADGLLDYRMTARVPFGLIIAEMVALETAGNRHAMSQPVAKATDIQKELIVIDLIRRDVEAGGPYREVITPDRLGNLATLNTWHMIAAPGVALDDFRVRYLQSPNLDLGDLWERAEKLQLMNQVPASVPPMGHVYTSARTGLGRNGGAIITHPTLYAALLIQAACRTLLEPEERTRMSISKIYDADPAPLRKAQELANRLLVHKRVRTLDEDAEVRELLQISVGWLLETGFNSYAHTVLNLLNDAHSPFAIYAQGMPG